MIVKSRLEPTHCETNLNYPEIQARLQPRTQLSHPVLICSLWKSKSLLEGNPIAIEMVIAAFKRANYDRETRIVCLLCDKIEY